MEIRRLSLQDIEMAKLNGTKLSDALDSATSSKKTASEGFLVDTQSSENFDAIKKLVGNAIQPGRSDMIAKIKAAVASGEFNVDSMSIANSMMADGFQEFLG